MKKHAALLIPIMTALIAISTACGKVPAGGSALNTAAPIHSEAPTQAPTEAQTAEPTMEIQPVAPPNTINAQFDSCSELAEAIINSESSAYSAIRRAPYSDKLEDLGHAYVSFLQKLESGELVFPIPQFDGKPAKLNRGIYEAPVIISSSEKFELPCIFYRVEHNGLLATIVISPLTVGDALELTGSETYSDISKKLNPLYPTEDGYSEHFRNVIESEIELSGGRRVRATILEETVETSAAFRKSYRFLYDGFIVDVWKWEQIDDGSDPLTDEFFKSFSLGGDLLKAGD